MKTKYYKVIEDLQGGDFGMNRVLSIAGWRKQALEWACSDDNEDLIQIIKRTKKEDLIDTISEIWSLVFEETEKTKNIIKELKGEQYV